MNECLHVYMFTYSPVYAFTMYVHTSTQYIRHVLATCHGKAQPSFRISETSQANAGQASNAQDIRELLASVPHKTAIANLVAECLTRWQIASWIWLKRKTAHKVRRAIWSVGPQSSL